MSLSLNIETYLRNQPRDEEFEAVISDMTLANFNETNVNNFVSKIFDSNISDVKQVNPDFPDPSSNNGHHNPPYNPGPSQPYNPGPSQPYNNQGQGHGNGHGHGQQYNQGHGQQYNQHPNPPYNPGPQQPYNPGPNNHYNVPNNQNYQNNQNHGNHGNQQGNFPPPSHQYQGNNNQGHPEPFVGNQGPSDNQKDVKPNPQNVGAMNDDEFEDALDDFIKGLKDL